MSTNMCVTLLNKCVNKHGGKWQHRFSVYIQVLVVFWISQLCAGKIICCRSTAKIALPNQAEVSAEGDRKQPVALFGQHTRESEFGLRTTFKFLQYIIAKAGHQNNDNSQVKKYLEFNLIFTTNALSNKHRDTLHRIEPNTHLWP